MRYLVTTEETYSPMRTEWFTMENNFNTELGMVVYDLEENKYCSDGKTWHDIEIDHL